MFLQKHNEFDKKAKSSLNVHWIDRKSNPLNETAKKRVRILNRIPFNTGNRTNTQKKKKFRLFVL